LQPLATPTFATIPAKTTKYTLDFSIGYVSGATGYTIQYATDSNFTTNVKTLDRPYNGGARISGLAAGTLYYARVKAVGNGTTTADSAWSKTIAAKTKPEAQHLAAPTVTATAKSASEITVTVSKVAGASSYTIRYATNAQALSAPTLAFSALASTSLTVNIGSVAGASGYALQYATNANFTDAIEILRTSSGPASVSGLTPSATYYLRAKALGDDVNYLDSAWP
jgi:hypothetical protein